jgi:rhomboid protease GluP
VESRKVKVSQLRLNEFGNKSKATYAILVINLSVWMLLTILGGSENPQILRRMGGIDSSLIHSGEYWRLLTAIFMHVGIIHLAVNGLSLIIIGKLVEQFFGTIRFVSIYLISGIGGSIASYTFIDPHVVGAGASAAIFGCLGALGSFFLIKHQSLGDSARQNFFGVLILAGINLAFGISTPGIDNWAHLGGFISGTFFGLMICPTLIEGSEYPSKLWRKFNVLSESQRIFIPLIIFIILLSGFFIVANQQYKESALSYHLKALDHFQNHEYSKALSSINKAIELKGVGPRAESLYLRALIHRDLGDRDQSVKDLRDAIYLGLEEPKRKLASEVLQKSLQSY